MKKSFLKAIILLFVLTLIFTAFSGCRGGKGKESYVSQNESSSEESVSDDDTVSDAASDDSNSTDVSKAPVGENSKSASTGASSNSPTKITNLKGRTITYLTYWEEPVKGVDPKGAAYWEAKKKIEKELNCTFKFVNGSRENLASSIMAGKPMCDVFTIPNEEVYPYFKQGLLYPLSNLSGFNFNDSSQWFPPSMEFGKINGKQYAMAASKFESGSFILYNKDLLKKYKQTDLYSMQKNGTLTWSKVFDVARACTKDGNYGLSGYMWDQDAMGVIAGAYNGPAVQRTGDGLTFKNSMNSSGYITAYTDFQKLFLEDKCIRPANENWQYLMNEFKNGKTAMIFSGPEYLLDVNFDAGICMIPAGRNATTFSPYYGSGVSVFSCIPATVEKPEEVAAVWNFIAPYLGPQDWRKRYQDYLSDDALECIGMMAKAMTDKKYVLDYSVAVLPSYGEASDVLRSIAVGTVTPAAGVQSFSKILDTAIADAAKK